LLGAPLRIQARRMARLAAVALVLCDELSPHVPGCALRAP
jgi:hypothetical protein